MDVVLGQRLADKLRGLAGHDPHPDGPYLMYCDCTDSYLAASFSSVPSLGVLLLSFGAGVLMRSNRKLAFWMLGVAAAVSMLDFSLRVSARLSSDPAPVRDLMLDSLPAQLLSNFVFQIALAAAAGLALASLTGGLRRCVRLLRGTVAT